MQQDVNTVVSSVAVPAALVVVEHQPQLRRLLNRVVCQLLAALVYVVKTAPKMESSPKKRLPNR